MNKFYEILNNLSDAAQKTYDGKKRNDLKDNDFLFPETRSFPIVTPADVKDAISSFGRMKSNMSYDEFLRKLYNKCKSKGPEFVAALPEASKEKLGINKSKSDDSNKNESIDMILSALKNIVSLTSTILNNTDLDRVKEGLTEPWVFGTIAVVEDNIKNVHDYIKFSESEDDTTSADESRPGLWENIRRKKQREGKKYKPAKTQKEGRPDLETWKKLTKDSKKS